MRFEQPWILLMLLALPLLAAGLLWGARRRQQALARLGDARQIARLTASVNARGRRWRDRLWLLAVAAVIVALARPQWGSTTQVVRQEGVQIMVVLDISASMLAQDVAPDRLTRAKQAIDELLRSLNGDQIGLVLFSGASFIQFPLTSDYATARSFLLSANPGMISRQGTALAAAIATAESGFSSARPSQQVIVIVSDGENHEGDTLGAARAAAANGILIFALGLGTPEGAPVPEYDPFGQLIGFKQDRNGQIVQSRLDEATLRAVAQAAGGQYFRASAGGSEIGVLADILEQIDGAELDSRFETQAVERFQLFIALALLALLAAELIPERRRAPADPAAAAAPESGSGARAPTLLALLLAGGLLTGCATGAPQLIAQGNQQHAAADYAAAIDSYAAAIAAGAEGAEPLYNTGNSQAAQGLYVEAQANLQSAGERADAPALTAATYYNLGVTYAAMQRWIEAAEAFRAVLRLNPADRDAKVALEAVLAQITPTPQPPTPTPTPTPDGSSDQGDQEQPIEQPDPSPTATPTPQPATPDAGDAQGGEQASPTPTAPGTSDDTPDTGDTGDGDSVGAPTPTPPPPTPPAGGQGSPAGRLSEEQARQLLDAIGQDVETLQERLQQILFDDRPEGQDW